VILLVPVVQAAAQISVRPNPSTVRFAAFVLVAFNMLALLTMNVHWAEQYWHAWMTPMLFIGYWIIRRAGDAIHTPAPQWT
jgi:hypothetical protein